MPGFRVIDPLPPPPTVIKTLVCCGKNELLLVSEDAYGAVLGHVVPELGARPIEICSDLKAYDVVAPVLIK
jgi:hypothetical protein